MKRSYFFLTLIIAVVTICLPFPAATQAQEKSAAGAEGGAGVAAPQTTPFEVKFAVICRDVVDREAVGAGSTFPASVGKLYCFTKIVGVKGPTEIIHVWYYGGTERARVTLAVNSPTWRTYSSKIIQAHETGEWHVDVLGAEGKSLLSVPFRITR